MEAIMKPILKHLAFTTPATARMSLSLFGALLAVLISGCASRLEYPPAPRTVSAPDYNYIIGPLDSVNIIVWRNPELSLTVPVRPDGNITTPLVDDLPAIGKSPTMLARDI